LVAPPAAMRPVVRSPALTMPDLPSTARSAARTPGDVREL
jgi:hypothetical protein